MTKHSIVKFHQTRLNNFETIQIKIAKIKRDVLSTFCQLQRVAIGNKNFINLMASNKMQNLYGFFFFFFFLLSH